MRHLDLDPVLRDGVDEVAHAAQGSSRDPPALRLHLALEQIDRGELPARHADRPGGTS
jgi:hypothetical protein